MNAQWIWQLLMRWWMVHAIGWVCALTHDEHQLKSCHYIFCLAGYDRMYVLCTYHDHTSVRRGREASCTLIYESMRVSHLATLSFKGTRFIRASADLLRDFIYQSSSERVPTQIHFLFHPSYYSSHCTLIYAWMHVRNPATWTFGGTRCILPSTSLDVRLVYQSQVGKYIRLYKSILVNVNVCWGPWKSIRCAPFEGPNYLVCRFIQYSMFQWRATINESFEFCPYCFDVR